MKVRITRKPVEREVDGVNLDRLAPGAVRDVSTSLASWLIAEGYAEPEMRQRDCHVDIDRRLSHVSEKPDTKDER